VIFGQVMNSDSKGEELDCLFSIEQLTERWLFASGTRTGWVGFPTICNGKLVCRLFSGRTKFGALAAPTMVLKLELGL
jgi:hypothetical protein